MNEIMNSQIPKLKLLKLDSLLNEENLQQNNFIKTERLFAKIKSKLTLLRYPTISINTQSNFSRNSIYQKLENSKKKKFRRYSQLPYLISENKKKQKYFNITPINAIEGYNNYLKEKTNRAYMKLNRQLFEQTIKRLSLPKYVKSKRGKTIRKEKSNNSNDNNNILDIDLNDVINAKLKIEKKHKDKKSLFEKEKMKCREKYKILLKNNFKELDNCEKKFDIVIDKTLKLLSEYKMSLSYLKNN